MEIAEMTPTGIWNVGPVDEQSVISASTKPRSIRRVENFSYIAVLSEGPINRKAAPVRLRYKSNKPLYERGLPTFQRKNMQESTDQ